jgi:long-chain acyl-CoA synthetase
VFFSVPDAGGFEYLGDPDKTREAYHGDRFTLGDRGYVDEDGYLFLTGRTSEVIIAGGVNIYPAEIDAVLLMHPALADAAVVGVPNEEFGEEVKAVVVLAEGHAPSPELAAELIAFCRARLAHFKCPRSVDFVPELPRSDAGKLKRRLVRKPYWEGLGREL